MCIYVRLETGHVISVTGVGPETAGSTNDARFTRTRQAIVRETDE
jgi:hypothetical protein